MNAFQLLELFISLSLQATLLALTCWALGRCTANDCTRARIWSTCQIALLSLFVLAISLPHVRLLPSPGTQSPDQLADATLIGSRWGQIIVIFWAAGAAFSLLAMLRSAMKLRRLLQESPTSPTLMANLPVALQQQLAGIDLRITNHLQHPFCWQFHRPLIVLPRSYLCLSPQELSLVLRHEIAHLQSAHPLGLWLQRIVETIYWYHPVVWWCGRQLSLSRELVCDMAATQTRDEIAQYLRVLLKVVEQADEADPRVWGLGLLFGGDFGALAQRARRLAERASRPQSFPASNGAAALVIAACLLITTAWLPLNPLNSSRALWSPCPAWTSSVLHDVGISVRDYEIYDRQLDWQDRLQDRIDLPAATNSMQPASGD
ncbi:M56 family metallopeptidase [Planctomicrobium piriforme]|uniref:Signal transducer regulating beta-lactamase production, contains metallopeptidase domain n=1 Tax=Planctomicrobium piriforme TaxID=1576369 RepID=A0A1I3C855_9PLAN|nr:M56 family metallopeptidase [Planctomicrobium piriforme]SFH70692.1 Signal transducer regulating beta-lactamase production, contains metallopeptidase domain [Planctomicrobium piriforme]